MRNLFLYMVAGVTLAACHSNPVTFEVQNPSDFERVEELVEVQLPNDAAKLGKLVDSKGQEVPYQLTADGRLLFQATVPAQGTVSYQMLADQPASSVTPKTAAFFLGDRRKDDFAWENDKAAYRMYGPALLPENPSSGVDLWLKHSSELTADAMYKQEEAGKPYHIDYGLGIDSYKVGHAAGCGGVAILANNEIWPGGPFKTYEILQEGPLQTVFRLTYDSVQVAGQVQNEVITVTVNAGSQVNKAEVQFTGTDVPGMQTGGAVFLHDEVDNLADGQEAGFGYLAYCENATSDKGIYRIHQEQGIDANTLDFGRNYVAILMAGAKPCLVGNTATIVNDYKMGDTFTYYFGGGWSKRDFKTDEEWIEATRKTAQALSCPLTVTVK